MSHSKPKRVHLEEAVISSNTGADAIKRAPIVEEDTGIRCLRIGDVSNNRPFREWGFTNADEKVIDKFLLRKDDIVIARTGNTIGVARHIEKDLLSVYNNGLIRLKIDKSKYDAKYIYYNLISESFKEFVYSISGGTSTQPNMKINHTLKYEIFNFSLNEQKYIAEILSSLDEKIEVNNQINKTLEFMAQEVFKYWFVDFEFPNENGEPYKSSGGEMVESELGMIPKGWEVGTLSELIIVRYGKDHKKLKDGDIPVYGSGGVMRHVDTSLYSSESVLIPRKGTLNNVIYVNEPFWSVDTMFFTEMKYSNVAKFVYFFVKAKDLLSMNTGSAVPSMTTDILNKLPVVIPPKSILGQFNEVLSPLFYQMESNLKENNVLSKLRDALLPKLMSGEIRVSLDGE